MSDELDFERELEAQVLKEEATRWWRMAYQAQVDGRLEEAIRLYTESIEIYPTAEAYTFRGWAKSYQGRLDEAIADCHHAIEVDPEFGNPYNDIGAYLIQKGDHFGAIPWLEKALQARRYECYFYAHFNLGRVYEKHGELIRALNCYKAAYDENHNYTQALKAYRRLQAQVS
jgi:tetratricopeptide (TPR) repeat protein